MLDATQPNPVKASEEPSVVMAEAINLNQATVENIQAEQVRMVNSSAVNLVAEEVDVRESFVMRMDGTNINLQESATGVLQGESVTCQESTTGIVQASHAAIDGGAAVFISTGSAEFLNSRAGVVLSRQVSGERLNSIVLLAGKVEGTVETVVDTPRALLAGLAFGATIGTFMLLGSLLSRRK